jgi:hypothetical protein
VFLDALACGAGSQGDVLKPLYGFEALDDGVDLVRFPAHGDDLQAVVVVEVNICVEMITS